MVQYSPDDIPKTGDVVAGMIEWEVNDDAEETTTQSGKAAVKVGFTAVAPEDVAGRQCFETFTIGSDADPLASDPKTTSGPKATFGIRMFRDLVAACGLRMSGNLAQDAINVRGKRFTGQTVAEVQKDGQYAGTVKSRIKKYFLLGSKALSIRPVDDEGRMGPPQIVGSAAPTGIAPAGNGIAGQPAMAASAPPPPPPPPASSPR